MERRTITNFLKGSFIIGLTINFLTLISITTSLAANDKEQDIPVVFSGKATLVTNKKKAIGTSTHEGKTESKKKAAFVKGKTKSEKHTKKLINPENKRSLESTIFSYEPVSKKNLGYLHAHLEGETIKGINWSAKDVTSEDIPFHQGLYSDPRIMVTFGDGLPRTVESINESFTNTWIPRYQKGQPHGGFTIFDAEANRVGHFLTGIANQAGHSQISYLYTENVWGHGIGTSVLNSIVNDWAPEVRRIGLGVRLQESDAAIIKAFRCFKGKPLKTLEAIASPANVPSWKILKRNGFSPARGIDENAPIIDLSNVEFDGKRDGMQEYKLLEQHVLQKYYTEDNPDRLEIGKQYLLTDQHDQLFTLSYHPKYKNLRFHFEKFVN